MVKRNVIDVLIGAVLALLSQIIQYGAYLLGLVLGLSFTYESAPVDPGSHPEWLAQINLMMLISALPVFVLAFVAARVVKVPGAGEGLRSGLIWAGVVAVWHLLVGLGNGTLAMFGTPGLWVFFAAFALGPVVAGCLRQRQPVR